MMDFTIYTLGDIAIFRSVLNAAAMVFNSGLLSGSGGLGLGAAVGLGLLITVLIHSFMSTLQPLGMGKQFHPGIFVALIVLWSAMLAPKVRVQIVDYYTGSATAVDNVPIGLAAPAAIVSAVSKSAAQKIETAFSTTGGNYISLSAQGFTNPLRLLMAMRKGVATYNPYLVATIRAFTIDCAKGSANFNPNDFANASNSIDYLTTHFSDGLTVSFLPSNPLGEGHGCTFVATQIAQATTAFINNTSATGLKGLLNRNMPTKATPGTSTAGTFSKEDVDDAFNALAKTAFASNQASEAFMLNALFASTIGDTYNCAVSAADMESINNCTLLMTQANEQWKTDAAGAGGMFTKTMIPAMNVLLALFFAFSPIVFIFAIMSGERSLQILGKYLFFAVWTQSWLPFAAVINYLIQASVEAEMYRFAYTVPGGAGLVLAISNEFYDLLSTKLALASDMLGAVPILSYSIFSAAPSALTSLAGRWSGRDYVDEKVSSPSLSAPAPVFSGGGIAQFQAVKQISPHAGSVNTGMTGALPTFSVGATASNQLQNAQSMQTQATDSLAKNYGRDLSNAVSKVHTVTDISGFTRSAESSMSGEQRQAMRSAREKLNSAGITGTDQEQWLAEAGTSASLGVSVLGGTGAGVSLANKYLASKGVTMSEEQRQAVISASESVNSTVSGWRSALASQSGHNVTKALTTVYSGSDKVGFSEALSRVQSAADNVEQSRSLVATTGVSATVDSQNWGAIVNRNGDGPKVQGMAFSLGRQAQADSASETLRKRFGLSSDVAMTAGAGLALQQLALDPKAEPGQRQAALDFLAGVHARATGINQNVAAPEKNLDREAHAGLLQRSGEVASEVGQQLTGTEKAVQPAQKLLGQEKPSGAPTAQRKPTHNNPSTTTAAGVEGSGKAAPAVNTARPEGPTKPAEPAEPPSPSRPGVSPEMNRFRNEQVAAARGGQTAAAKRAVDQMPGLIRATGSGAGHAAARAVKVADQSDLQVHNPVRTMFKAGAKFYNSNGIGFGGKGTTIEEPSMSVSEGGADPIPVQPVSSVATQEVGQPQAAPIPGPVPVQQPARADEPATARQAAPVPASSPAQLVSSPATQEVGQPQAAPIPGPVPVQQPARADEPATARQAAPVPAAIPVQPVSSVATHAVGQPQATPIPGPIKK
jgi:conjugal transfer mating pair stabilization protein TraG